jgi:PncC family amidohydrolase
MKEVEELYRRLSAQLIEKNVTITAMESITGGLISSLITDNPGISAVFRGSFVTYSNEAKIANGVPKNVIEEYGVYSEETARAMAQASREKMSADIGIGVTGSTGNIDPENPDSQVGVAYYAVDVFGQISGGRIDMGALPERKDYKLKVAETVAEHLLSVLEA